MTPDTRRARRSGDITGESHQKKKKKHSDTEIDTVAQSTSYMLENLRYLDMCHVHMELTTRNLNRIFGKRIHPSTCRIAVPRIAALAGAGNDITLKEPVPLELRGDEGIIPNL